MIRYIFHFFIFSIFTLNALEPIFPSTLKPGDTIAIVAPASPAKEDDEAIAAGVRLLIARGYKVRLARNVRESDGLFAGNDKKRAEMFMEAWTDPETKGIWCYRGGYGCARILDRIDYSYIKKHPKVLIGMSDITALHAAINKKTGLVTFLGPNMDHVFVSPTTRRLTYNETELWNIVSNTKNDQYLYKNPSNFPLKGHPIQTIRRGVAKGRLTGGTLSIITSLIGTPWEIDTKGKILLLEEVDEKPYRIDRMLSQLKQAGHLDHLAGVVLCSWKKCLGKENGSDSLVKVFEHYFDKAPYPVLLGFPSGHIPAQTTLPLNVLAELDATKHTLRLLESPVSR
ncbi:MAG: LD-carboxypeptidase [Waddliaceae bacterium]